MTDGLLVEVLTKTRGSQVTSALSAAATTIPVEDTTDFDETGGRVQINDVVYNYTAVDVDASTITLATGLTGSVADLEPVWVMVGSQVGLDYWAIVSDPDDDGEPIEVPLLSREERLAWPVRVYEPPIPVTVAPDHSRLIGAPGTTPEMDGAYIDPTTIPEPVPIEAPDHSPTLLATGMPATILLRTTEPIDATTFLTYQVLVGAVWTDLNDTPARSEVFVVKTLPDGSDLVDGTTYQFRTVAGNAAGDAAASASTDGQVDTSAVALVAAQLITEQVVAGFALLGALHIGGDTFTLTPPGVDPENPSGGLRIQLSDGGLIHLPADGSPAVFSGDVVARFLEVADGARIAGAIEVRGPMTLAGTTVPNPTSAPTVQANYSDIQTVAASPIGICLAPDDASYVTLSDGQLVMLADDGVTVTATVDAPLGAIGVTRLGTAIYVLHWRSASGDFAVSEYDDTLVFQDTTALPSTGSARGNRAAIGTDGTNLVVGLELHDGTDWSGDVVMTRYSTAFAVVSTITLPTVGLIGGVYYGTAGGDFAANRWVLQPRNDDVKVYNTSGVEQVADEWPRPYDKTVRGLWNSGADAGFLAIDNVGIVRSLLSSAAAPAATYWWSYAWADSDTHTTLVSPQTSHTRPKRAGFLVSASSAPQENTAGTHVANRVAFYAATSSGGTKWLQSTPAAGVKSAAYFASFPLTSGTSAPGSNNFPAAAAIPFAAEAGGFTVDGESNGSVGTGTFRTSVDARVTALAQPLDSDLTAVAALSPANDDVLQRKAGAWTNRTMAQVKTDLALAKGDVGLGNVDNTSDVNKPVSTAQQAAITPALGGNAAFNSAANAVNTTGKYTGRPGFNTVTGKPIYASGPNATDVWKFYSDDTTAHTPV